MDGLLNGSTRLRPKIIRDAKLLQRHTKKHKKTPNDHRETQNDNSEITTKKKERCKTAKQQRSLSMHLVSGFLH